MMSKLAQFCNFPALSVILETVSRIRRSHSAIHRERPALRGQNGARAAGGRSQKEKSCQQSTHCGVNIVVTPQLAFFEFYSCTCRNFLPAFFVSKAEIYHPKSSDGSWEFEREPILPIADGSLTIYFNCQAFRNSVSLSSMPIARTPRRIAPVPRATKEEPVQSRLRERG